MDMSDLNLTIGQNSTPASSIVTVHFRRGVGFNVAADPPQQPPHKAKHTPSTVTVRAGGGRGITGLEDTKDQDHARPRTRQGRGGASRLSSSGINASKTIGPSSQALTMISETGQAEEVEAATQLT
ncbi:uncharacterized protein CPUR_03434 [Claviceps purpurea 20.1]|uniref:Uncharacterized protein n=1 Tax=Claviceps purpurea (strain 20.1) TaxID=1111077 RepID=M1VVI6_CLAP2|nr:uncharacterized protein CPUR_03434 [Claviceps purpurea 20.1]